MRARHIGAASAVVAALALPVMSATSAAAVDKYGPGYSVPDDHGKPGSHLGAYGKPGKLFPHATAHAYCSDPKLAGPAAGGQYSKIHTYSEWKSKATGKKVSKADFARASFILAVHGETQNDVRAAAVDASVTSLLNKGTSYELPDGKRAKQRLSYGNVPRNVAATAKAYLKEAKDFAGPYTLRIHQPDHHPAPGKIVNVKVDVLSSTGHKVPGAKIHLKATGATQAEGTVTAGKDGTASAWLVSAKAGEIHLKGQAINLPALKVRAQIPSNDRAQRMVIPYTKASTTVKGSADITTVKTTG